MLVPIASRLLLYVVKNVDELSGNDIKEPKPLRLVNRPSLSKIEFVKDKNLPGETLKESVLVSIPCPKLMSTGCFCNTRRYPYLTYLNNMHKI